MAAAGSGKIVVPDPPERIRPAIPIANVVRSINPSMGIGSSSRLLGRVTNSKKTSRSIQEYEQDGRDVDVECRTPGIENCVTPLKGSREDLSAVANRF